MAEERKRNWVKILLIVLWAFAFAEGPLYIDQYRNHLSGHLEELRYQMNQIEKIMGIPSFDLERTFQEMAKSAQEEVAKAGQFLAQMVDRYVSLQKGWQALEDAGPILKPFTFARHVNWDIARETCNSFTFGIPFTIDALLYAIVGGLVGWGVYNFIIYAYEKMRGLLKIEK